MRPDLREGGHRQAESLLLRPNEGILTRDQMTRLIQLNLNTANLNRSAYLINFGQNGEKFKAGSYDPISLVWVQINPRQKALLIRDGHHRAAVVNKHWEEITKDGFQPTVREVTEDYLPQNISTKEPPEPLPFNELLTRTPDLTITATADEGPRALTMREYQRILIEPTLAQKDILSLRVAISLMQSWGSFVEDEAVAAKFPALAALAYLEQQVFKYADPDKTREFLEGHDHFFTGNTIKEVQTVREGLFSMATVIHDNHVLTGGVLDSAFVVIGAKDEFLDVSSQTKAQLRGLFHLPVVEQKYQDAYGDQPHEWIKDRLAESFGEALPEDRYGAEKMGREMYDALVDPDLSIDEVRSVITTPKRKAETHREIRKQHVVEELKTAYLAHVKRDATIGAEEGVLRRFAGPDRIGGFKRERIFADVARYDDLISGANALLAQLASPISGLPEEKRKEFITDLRKKIKMARQRSGDLLTSSLESLASYTTTIERTLEQPAPVATPAPNRKETDVRENEIEDRIGETTASPVPAVTLFLLARTLFQERRSTAESSLEHDEERRQLQRRVTELEESAWWRSPDFTPNEQRAMQSVVDGRLKSFAEDEGMSVEEVLEVRKQVILKRRRLERERARRS